MPSKTSSNGGAKAPPFQPLGKKSGLDPKKAQKQKVWRIPSPASSPPADLSRSLLKPWAGRAPDGGGGSFNPELSYYFGKRYKSPNGSNKNDRLFYDPPRRNSRTHRLVRTCLEQPQIPLHFWGSPNAPCHRRLARDEAWRRLIALRSLTLARLILLSSRLSIGHLGFGLEQVCSNLKIGPTICVAGSVGKRSPNLERSDELQWPAPGRSQKKFRIPLVRFPERPPPPFSTRHPPNAFCA